jgi:hypothetical protein
MDVPDLGDGDQLPALPAVRGQRLGVDPPGGLPVAGDFQVVPKLLGADRPAGIEEDLDFPQDQGVALDGGGIMGFEMPDVVPDPGRLRRGR